MRVVALSAASWAEATRRAAGVEPFEFPAAYGVDESAMVWPAVAGADLLYVNLHGLRGQPYWYGDGLVTAVAAAWLRTLDLLGVVAFVTSCWGMAEDGAPGPMVGALLEAGAAAVVAGPGLNYGGERKALGADLLGEWFRRGLGLGWSVQGAFAGARAVVYARALFSEAARDALGFRIVGDGWARAGRGPLDSGLRRNDRAAKEAGHAGGE